MTSIRLSGCNWVHSVRKKVHLMYLANVWFAHHILSMSTCDYAGHGSSSGCKIYLALCSLHVIMQDMAAHSACDFGGGKAEKLALAKYRQMIWQGRVLNSQFTDEELRSQGRCPLTPEEIGLLLAALGFDNSTRLYLASHKVNLY